MARALKPGGKFFIEVRSVHDPLYGKGEALERNAFFYDNHYRRFLVLDELTAVSYTHLDVYKRQPLATGRRSPMLQLSLRPGEYLTIHGDIVDACLQASAARMRPLVSQMCIRDRGSDGHVFERYCAASTLLCRRK